MTDNDETQAKLLAMMKQIQEQSTPQAPGFGGAGAVTGAPPVPIGISVTLKLETMNGIYRPALQYGPEHAATPQAIHQLVMSLLQAGYPVDSWQPRSGGSGWRGSRGGGFGGGFGGAGLGGW